MVADKVIEPGATPPRAPHESYTVCLQDEFRFQGLQVIIRIQSISLSPEQPEYTGGRWELAGQKNEHIVATAMFAYDVHNVTKSDISFPQETELRQDFVHYGHDVYQGPQNRGVFEGLASRQHRSDEMDAIADIFGLDPDRMSGRPHDDFELPVQEIGKVALPQGRLITFPNSMECRREPFWLEDKTRSGHHRWVTLMLVDPNYRICSTGNVPDQKEKEGERIGAESRFSKEEARANKREMEKEHACMQYARYDRMGTGF
jgi:hypothetical protein